MYVVKTPHIINATVVEAVYKGLKAVGMTAKMVDSMTPPMEPPAASISYGILRGTMPWLTASETFLYLDKSFLRASHFDGYYRISKNGFQPDYLGGLYARDKRSPHKIAPMNELGANFFIMPPTEHFAPVLGISPCNFVALITEWLQYHGVKPENIEVRDKNTAVESLDVALKRAALVIAANSGAALKSILAGVPAISMANTTLWSFLKVQDARHEIPNFDAGNPLEVSPFDLINLCINTKFDKLFDFIASNEYTIPELERGEPWMQFISDGIQGKMSHIGYARIPFAADGRIQRPRYMR